MKKRFFLPLLFACACALRAGADGAWVDRVPGIAPDTYADFPVRAGGTFEVAVSNAAARPAFFRLRAPENAEGSVLLGFRRYRGRCALFVDGRPADAFDDVFPGPVHVLVPEAALPDERGDAYVQSLAPFAFADAFMVAQGDKTGLQSWEKLAGDWSLHAVTGRTVRAEDKNKLSRFPTQARSPNFYCLNGFGSHALITAGEAFYSHYALRASIQQNGGTNGLAFLVSEEGAGYTFTAQPNPATGRLDFILRAGCVAGERAGDFVAGVETQLTPGQWYLLETRLTDDEVICYVDGVAVIRRKLALPAGGRFGLYCHTLEAHAARFDDVSAETWCGTDFSLADGKANGAREMSLGAVGDPPAAITLPASLSPGATLELDVGTAQADGPGATTAGFAVTLLVERRDGGFSLRLSSQTGCVVDDGDAVEIEDTSLPAVAGGMRAFTLDATDAGYVAGRIDGVTCVAMFAPEPPLGAARYRVEGRARFGYPSVTRAPSPYTDRFEKNKIFVADPYMRHWASTAGQWLTYTNGTAWYKDDVLNRVSLSLPVLNGIDLRLGVGEAPLSKANLPVADGRFDVRVLCASNTLALYVPSVTNDAPVFTWAYPAANLIGETGALSATNAVTLRFDGRRLAFSSATGARFTCPLPHPHTGRRMYFGRHPSPAWLNNVLVHREPVLDCLFSESLHDWTINGGTWEIINRFQCYPDWSHMDGENPDSVAALWSKYAIGGDFCVTFVCGMRHGGMWYDRVGDFNLTVFNDRTTPSEGYTLKVTDWDPNHSQRWSRLFRNGALLAKTDVKAAPRRREGNIRTGYEPLVAKGRDVHGAWYTVKFRKIGGHLEALFDNLPLLAVDDPEPLNAGGFGIWTYRSSMVVARVRVTAERIAPRAFAFTPLAAERAPAQKADDADAAKPNLFFNGLPADLLRPAFWHAADEVSCPEITFSEEGDETVMTVTSLHGSGSFLAAALLPETTVDKLAGWTCEVARSPDAQFNFAFSLACGGATNTYAHVLCGTDEARGPLTLAGRSPAPAPTPADARKKIWTPVTVWIPATGHDPRVETVRFEGFGNLQPSDVQQGLHGNGPGAWYAVRRLHPVYRDTPSPDNAGDNAAAFNAAISRAFEKGKAGQLNAFKVPSSLCPTHPTLHWVLPPADNPGLIATVLGAPTNAIRIASTLAWPNPLLCVSNVTVAGQPAERAYIADNALVIPYARPFTPASIVKVSFTPAGGRPFTQMLPAALFARPAGAPERAPTITSVAFPPALGASYENFESRTGPLARFAHDATRRDLRYGDGAQATYLHFHNAGRPSRLSGCLATPFRMAQTPLLQFRYRGDDMALVNISPRQGVFYHFSDTHGGQERPAKLDDAWHTAFCNLSTLAFEARPAQIFANAPEKLVFTSNHISVPGIAHYHINQTGLFSYLDIDDIALGPAIGPANADAFRFRAAIDAPDGLAAAEYALLPGPAPYDARPAEEREALAWTVFDPAATNGAAPALTRTAEGVHHLLVRARAPGGATSPVVDIPFLYDSRAPEVTLALATGAPPGASATSNAGDLTITVRGGAEGAPPVLTNALLTVNGTRVSPVQHNANIAGAADNSLTCTLKWPRLGRGAIQAATNGATIRFRLENVFDGAGNAAAPAEAAYRIDYASDHLCPDISYSASQMGLYAGWPRMSTRESFFLAFDRGLEAKHDARAQILTLRGLAEPKGAARSAIRNFQNQNQGSWLVPTNRWLFLRARIPEKSAAPTGEVFRLVFQLVATPAGAKTPAKNNVYTLSVPARCPADAAARPAGLRARADFTPGTWVDLVLDVNAFLRAQAGATGDIRVSRLQLTLPAGEGAALEIARACIMKDVANLKRPIGFDAVDVSGVDGIYAGKEKLADGWRISFEKLYEAFGSAPYAEFVIRDRAGNDTSPIAIPLPPRD